MEGPVCPDCGGVKANRTARRCRICSWEARRAARGECRVNGCGRPNHGAGLCKPHRRRELKGRPVDTPIRVRVAGLPCVVPGCGGKRVGNGLCRLHYQRVWKHGDLGAGRRESEGHIDRKGYHCIRIKGREYKVHRLVMEQAIGRPLLAHERVHHVNGVRTDNRPENLELWSVSQPSGQRVTDKVAWAIELLELYAPELLATRSTQLRIA